MLLEILTKDNKISTIIENILSGKSTAWSIGNAKTPVEFNKALVNLAQEHDISQIKMYTNLWNNGLFQSLIQ